MHRTNPTLSALAMNLVLALALALGSPFASGQALQGTEFTFQGNLTQNGTPLDGTPNLEFRLFDSLGTQIGPMVSKPAWPVSDGAFTVELDFAAVFNGQKRLLEISVDGTVLAPRIPISNSPYALASQYAMPDSVIGSSIVDNTIGAADVKPAQLQLRVAGTCTAGNAIRGIDAAGAVTCEPIGAAGGGDITGVATAPASGLAGGTESGDASLSLAPLGVTTARLADAAVTNAKLANNAVSFEKIEDNSIGTFKIIDGVIRTADIALLQITSDRIAPSAVGVQQIDSDQVQRRITSSCPAGSALRVIDESGTQSTCESTAAWSRFGNAGTNPLVNFVGTTDNQVLDLRASNRRALRIVPWLDGSIGDVPSMLGGSSANSVASALGATVAGGGASANNGSPCPTCANSATGNFSVVGGGLSNEATSFANTVAGGSDNGTAGSVSTVGGGTANQADMDYATVPGGGSNCAGGRYSFAAGQRAKVRPRLESTACSGVPRGPAATGDEGVFVWADAANSDFVSSGPNQFLVRAAGGAGINTNTPRAPLHVQAGSTGLGMVPDPATVLLAEKATGNSFISILGAVGAQRGLIFGEPGSVADGGIFYDNAASNTLEFRTNGNVTRATIDSAGNLVVSAGAAKPGGGSWAATSDGRLKKHVAPIERALDRLLALRGVSFEYVQPDAWLRPPGEHIGFVAQEVQPVFPHWVEAGADGYLTVGPQGFEALTVEALRELKATQDFEVEALRADNRELRGELADLRIALDAVRAELRGGRPER